MSDQPTSLRSLVADMAVAHRNRDVVGAFLGDKEISQYDSILVFQVGGAARVGRVVGMVLDQYPQLRPRFHNVVLDYDVSPTDVRADWDVLNLGAIVDGSVNEVLAQTGIPEDFPEEGRSSILAYAAQNGRNSYSVGAGANPWLGLLGFRQCVSQVEDYLYEIFHEYRTLRNYRKILPIILAGSSGGTGAGIVPEFRRKVHSIAKTVGVEGTGLLSTVWFAWLAYQGIMYSRTGRPTEMARIIYGRSGEAWKRHKGDFFVIDEIGPDGFLGLVKVIAQNARVLNNAHEQRAYPNAVVRCRELTPWKLQRAAAFLINRGVAPKVQREVWDVRKVRFTGRQKWEISLALDASRFTTVREYAEGVFLLDRQRCLSSLRTQLGDMGVDPSQVINWGDADLLIDTQLTVIRGVAGRLLDKSGATGSFMMPEEDPLVDPLFSQTVVSVLKGSTSVVLPYAQPIELVVGHNVIGDRGFHMGRAELSFQLGFLGDEAEEPVIIPPSFVPVSGEEQLALEREAALRKAREYEERLK